MERVSTIDRDYTRYYGGTGRQRVCYLRHPNGIAVLCLAAGHPAITDTVVTKVDFNIGGKRPKDRSQPKAGNVKKTGLLTEPLTRLCRLSCANGADYWLRAHMVGTLVEVNERLLERPDWLARHREGRGFVAVLIPKTQSLLKQGLTLTLEDGGGDEIVSTAKDAPDLVDEMLCTAEDNQATAPKSAEVDGDAGQEEALRTNYERSPSKSAKLSSGPTIDGDYVESCHGSSAQEKQAVSMSGDTGDGGVAVKDSCYMALAADAAVVSGNLTDG